jgi:hypothetical protein
MALAAIWRGWWILAALAGIGLIVSGIYDLGHREEQWAKRRQKLPQKWQDRHGSGWVVQGAWVAIIGGLMIVTVSLFRLFKD